MPGEATNIHATAIVIGKTGLLFLGPSGSGKSALAFSCLAAAQPLGLNAMLIADDRVLIAKREGSIIAECPFDRRPDRNSLHRYRSHALRFEGRDSFCHPSGRSGDGGKVAAGRRTDRHYGLDPVALDPIACNLSEPARHNNGKIGARLD